MHRVSTDSGIKKQASFPLVRIPANSSNQQKPESQVSMLGSQTEQFLSLDHFLNERQPSTTTHTTQSLMTNKQFSSDTMQQTQSIKTHKQQPY